MSNLPYEPRNGDFAALIDSLEKETLQKLRQEQLNSIKEHQNHSQSMPESFISIKDAQTGKTSYSAASAKDQKLFNHGFEDAQKQINKRFTGSTSIPNTFSTTDRNPRAGARRTASTVQNAQSRVNQSAPKSRTNPVYVIAPLIIVMSSLVLILFWDELDAEFSAFLMTVIFIFIFALRQVVKGKANLSNTQSPNRR